MVFEIDDLPLRHKYLKLLIEERIGNPEKRNVQGLLPQQIEHEQPVSTLPLELNRYFIET